MKRTKRIVAILIIFILLVVAVLPSSMAVYNDSSQKFISSGHYGKGYRYNTQGWVYIHIEGEPYERGYQYGYLAYAEILDMINRWSERGIGGRILYFYKVKTPEQWWEICKSKSLNVFWKQYPDEYKDEVKGIADGVKDRGGEIFGKPVDYGDILTLSQMQETTVMLMKPLTGIHPFRDLIYSIKLRLDRGSSDDTVDIGMCSAFLATGDATPDGRIVAAHTSQFAYSITERCNIILDIEPSEGNRFIMTAPPGQIWSNENYYQSDAGIVIMETTPGASRFWTKRGIPWAIRARRAIQYSDDIDDVIRILKTGNNGLYPSEWSVGDTKTGEIASIELGFKKYAVKRTFNGFYWSCTILEDPKVRREVYGLFGLLPSFPDMQSKWASNRDEVFTELGEKYYGKFDIEIAKEIMSMYPICIRSSDAKITDSKLMEDLGLIAFMGIPNGTQWNPKNEVKEKYEGVTEFPPSGWLQLYGISHDPSILESDGGISYDQKKDSKELWKYETEDSRNMVYSSCVISQDILYAAVSTGTIYALNTDQGKMIWKQEVGERTVEPITTGNLLIVGTENGLYALDLETGNVEWKQEKGQVISKPVITNSLIISGFSDGYIYAFGPDSGEIKWTYGLSDSTIVSELQRDKICFGSDDACYAFDLENKEIIWEYKTDGKITASPRASSSMIYFGSWDGNIYALNSTDGSLKWKYETGWGIDTTPVISDRLVFVGSNDNNFYALDEENGDLKWFFTCRASIHSSPVIYGEYVFFGSDDGRLYALNKTDGRLAWDFTPGFFIENDNAYNYKTTPILSSPLVEDGIVYFGAKGNVYALDAQTVEKPSHVLKEEISILYVEAFILLACIGVVLLLISLIININSRKKGR